MDEQHTAWRRQNLSAIEARLAPVRALPDGILYRNPWSPQDILVYKEAGVVYLYFHAELDAEIQSRLVLDTPLHLLSPYTQMVMLSLLWRPDPQRIFIIGFGGGRLPMVLHHVLPAAVIDCAEINTEVVDVARRFFGVAFDHRLCVTLQDGRKLLRGHAGAPYDIIVVDAFTGLGCGPHALATQEFYALCREHLSPEGVVVVNMLDNDPATPQKRLTLTTSFPRVFGIRDEERGNQVLFGCHSAATDMQEVVGRAQALQEKLGLSFSLQGLASSLQMLPPPVPGSRSAYAVLRDEVRFEGRPGRNDACPCGSPKKYKKCCGRHSP